MLLTILAVVVIVGALGVMWYARAHSNKNSKAQVAKAREAYARDVNADQ